MLCNAKKEKGIHVRCWSLAGGKRCHKMQRDLRGGRSVWVAGSLKLVVDNEWTNQMCGRTCDIVEYCTDMINKKF